MISDTTIVESVRPRVMEFDLGALTHNYRTPRAQIGPEPHIIPALKGNAYGHGVGPIARCLAEFDIHSLSTGDHAGRAWARERLASFDAFLDSLDAAGLEIPVPQALASSGLIAGLESRANAVCPGHLIYAISPVTPDVADISRAQRANAMSLHRCSNMKPKPAI